MERLVLARLLDDLSDLVPADAFIGEAEATPWTPADTLAAATAWAGTIEASRRTLVDALAHLDTPSWAHLLQLTGAPGLEDTVAALLDTDEDWFDFDAPGEGELPTHWARILALSGRWSDGWLARFDALADGDPSWEDAKGALETCDLAVLLAGYTSPLEGAFERTRETYSPISSYGAGMHVEVGESFGDVYSPADPFYAPSAAPPDHALPSAPAEGDAPTNE